MDKFTDSGMPDTISPGLYSQSDILDIENLQKMKYAVDLTILCNRVCFREFSAPMTNEQKECHTGCFDNFYSALLYTQRKFYEEVNKK